MRTFVRPLATLVLLLATCLQAVGDEPVWLIYQRGLERMKAGEYGEALALFERVQARGALLPEVALAIGDVFRIEGEPDLAERQYRRAVDLRAGFQVPDDRYVALGRLADLYWSGEKYRLMEQVLADTLREDPGYLEDTFHRHRDQVSRIFRESGLDRVLSLYRIQPVLAAQAHSRLGLLYARTARPLEAIEHCLFSITAILTDAMAEYRRGVPAYRYSGVSGFLALAEQKPRLLAYLGRTTLDSDLYHLGLAMLALGEEDEAVAVWHVLGRSALAGSYRNLADRQVTAPRMERLLPLE